MYTKWHNQISLYSSLHINNYSTTPVSSRIFTTHAVAIQFYLYGFFYLLLWYFLPQHSMVPMLFDWMIHKQPPSKTNNNDCTHIDYVGLLAMLAWNNNSVVKITYDPNKFKKILVMWNHATVFYIHTYQQHVELKLRRRRRRAIYTGVVGNQVYYLSGIVMRYGAVFIFFCCCYVMLLPFNIICRYVGTRHSSIHSYIVLGYSSLIYLLLIVEK